MSASTKHPVPDGHHVTGQPRRHNGVTKHDQRDGEQEKRGHRLSARQVFYARTHGLPVAPNPSYRRSDRPTKLRPFSDGLAVHHIAAETITSGLVR